MTNRWEKRSKILAGNRREDADTLPWLHLACGCESLTDRSRVWYTTQDTEGLRVKNAASPRTDEGSMEQNSLAQVKRLKQKPALLLTSHS